LSREQGFRVHGWEDGIFSARFARPDALGGFYGDCIQRSGMKIFVHDIRIK